MLALSFLSGELVFIFLAFECEAIASGDSLIFLLLLDRLGALFLRFLGFGVVVGVNTVLPTSCVCSWDAFRLSSEKEVYKP